MSSAEMNRYALSSVTHQAGPLSTGHNEISADIGSSTFILVLTTAVTSRAACNIIASPPDDLNSAGRSRHAATESDKLAGKFADAVTILRFSGSF